MNRWGVALVAGASLLVSACSSNAPTSGALPQSVQNLPAAKTQTLQAAATNVVQDPGFESGAFTSWKQCGTVNASITNAKSHSGTYSEFGGSTATPEINGDAAVCQTVTVPAGATFSFWVYQGTTDTIQYAWQEAQFLSSTGSVLKTFMKTASSTNGWVQKTYDASSYAGKTVTIKFDVHGNGYSSAYVYQYVDDVSLAGGGPTPSPSPSHSPSPSPSPSGSPSPSPSPSPTPVGGSPIKHVVIILQENRSSDDLFHGFTGFNYATTGQDHNGKPVTLKAIPLMNSWDPAHHYSNWKTEYNGGAMNGFDQDVLDYGSGAPTDFAYDYAQQSDVQPYWDMATEGVVTDNSFTDHRSESYSGHLYPIAAASGPVSPSQPNIYFSEDGSGSCASSGTAGTINIQTGVESGSANMCIGIQTLADLLDVKGISWRYYVPSADKTQYVSAYSQISQIYHGSAWSNVVTPETTVLSDAQAGNLPAVSWVIGTFANSDHDGQNVPSSNGPTWVTSVLNAIGQGPDWNSTAVFITWDDWGGWYDHVKPTTFDAFEPGFRVPIIVVSPYALRGTVNHDVHYTSSILHYIETNFGLGSLGKMDARADNLLDVFNYSQAPLPYVTVKATGPMAKLFESDLPGYGDRAYVTPEDRD